MKTKLYREALKLYYKWACQMTFHTSFWIPAWDDFLFWFNYKYVPGFVKDALTEFNYCNQILKLKFTNKDYTELKRDYMLSSWQKFLEDNKRYRKIYWDADAVLKRAVSGEGDLER